MYSTTERIDGCKYSIEITVPSKERIARPKKVLYKKE